MSAAAVVLAGAVTAIGTHQVARAEGVVAPCTPYTLPGPAGSIGTSVESVTAQGLYGGNYELPDGTWHAAYWTHAGADLSTGWTVHPVDSGVSTGDFIASINAGGVMLGTSYDTGQAYVFDPRTGAVTFLPGLGGGYLFARRINDHGEAVGTAVDTHGVSYATTWSPPYGSAHRLPVVGAAQAVGTRDYKNAKLFSQALGVNNSGLVAGETAVGGPVEDVSQFASQGEWRGGLTPLARPITWGPTGAPGKLPVGYSQGYAWDVDEAGVVVGNSDTDSSITARPAYWTTDGRYHDMGAPADTEYGNTYGISRGGWAGGGVSLADGNGHAFVWTGAGSLQLLPLASGFVGSNAHDAEDTLHQAVGEMADAADASTATVWQCPADFTTG